MRCQTNHIQQFLSVSSDSAAGSSTIFRATHEQGVWETCAVLSHREKASIMPSLPNSSIHMRLGEHYINVLEGNKYFVTGSVNISYLNFIKKIQNNGVMVIILSSPMPLNAWWTPVSLTTSCASSLAGETPWALVVSRALHLLSISVYTFQNLACLWQLSFGHYPPDTIQAPLWMVICSGFHICLYTQ